MYLNPPKFAIIYRNYYGDLTTLECYDFPVFINQLYLRAFNKWEFAHGLDMRKIIKIVRL